MLKKIATGILLAGTLVSTTHAATHLKVQTSTKSGEYGYQYLNQVWAEKLPQMTNGEVTIELLPVNSVVSRTETPEAVAAGILSGDLTSIEYFGGRGPAFKIMGNLIAGYDSPVQTQQYCRDGGGKEIMQELWDKKLPGRIHVVGCGAASKEALVSKVPIEGVDALKGIKIRSPEGMAAVVFKAAGATPLTMSPSEVYTALEKGVIDAADASAYVNNSSSGFHEIASYPLYPGIHSMAVRQFTINQKIWNKLSPAAQQGVERWFVEAYAALQQELDKKDKELVEMDIADPDVTVINWPQQDRDRFRAIASKAWEEVAGESAEARRALESHYTYMRSIGLM